MPDLRNPHDQGASQKRAVAHERRSTACLRSSSRPARAILGPWITRQQFLSERLHSRNLEAVAQSRTSRSSCAKRAILSRKSPESLCRNNCKPFSARCTNSVEFDLASAGAACPATPRGNRTDATGGNSTKEIRRPNGAWLSASHRD